MIRRAHQAARSNAFRARALVVLVTMRVLVLLFTVELSGLSHAALDVLSAASGDLHAESDCEDEEGGHECPPGCPSCHCWHAGTPSTPLRMEPGRRIVLKLTAELGFVPAQTMPPAGADPASVYRPPRVRTRA
jgi:hypothetical protein